MKQIQNNSFLTKITEIPEEPGLKRKFVLGLRVLLVSVHRFVKDDCLVIASSLSYTTIVTLIPTLTVALALITVVSGIQQTRQSELGDEINSFLVKNGIQFDFTPYLDTISDIINTASQIGAVGFVVFIFSATAVLRSLEKAFHTIWKIDLHRGFISKFVFYFFLISFGPLLFLVGKSITDKISDDVRSPHIKSIVSTKDGQIWVAGEKGNIGLLKDLKTPVSFIPKAAIDFENMLCVDDKIVETGTCKVPDITKENFFRIRHVREDIFSISEEGSLLYSRDHGKSWKLHSLRGLSVADFGSVDVSVIFVITADNRTVRYELGKPYTEVKKFSDTSISPNRIRFLTNKDGFILDREGRIWKTSDGGNSFFPQSISDKPLNDITFLNKSIGFLVGDSGVIYKTSDGGYSWTDIRHKRYSYDRVWVFPTDSDFGFEIFILNTLGDIIYSKDGGDNWSVAYKSKGGMILDMIHLSKKISLDSPKQDTTTESENIVNESLDNTDERLVSYTLNENMMGIVGVGEYNKVIRVEKDDSGKAIWKRYQGGKRFFSLYSLLQILIPLAALWLFFVMIFTIIPNTKVPFKAASIGSAVTGVILIIFFWGFVNIYIASFTEKTMIIYKALAAIPIFLLTIYSIASIILYGAQVTATLQFKDRYLLPKSPFDDIDSNLSYEFYFTLQVLMISYEVQTEKGKFVSLDLIRKKFLLSERDLKVILEKLTDSGYISLVDEKFIAPVKLKEQVDIKELYEKTSTFKLGGPLYASDSASSLSKALIQVESKMKEELQKLKVSDFI